MGWGFIYKHCVLFHLFTNLWQLQTVTINFLKLSNRNSDSQKHYIWIAQRTSVFFTQIPQMLTFSLSALLVSHLFTLKCCSAYPPTTMFSFKDINYQVRALALTWHFNVTFRQPRFHPTQAFLGCESCFVLPSTTCLPLVFKLPFSKGHLHDRYHCFMFS